MNRFHRWYCQTSHWRRALTRELIPWALRGTDLGDDVLEIGPGPGLATDFLRQRATRVTAVEVDSGLAATLTRRLKDTNVRVVSGDGSRLPFMESSFSGAVCFTMLHHVPCRELQDRLLSEVRRVLRPGATFAGSDSRPSLVFRVAHLFDTMVPVDPDTFADRLEAAGFREVAVRAARNAFRFRARR